MYHRKKLSPTEELESYHSLTYMKTLGLVTALQHTPPLSQQSLAVYLLDLGYDFESC